MVVGETTGSTWWGPFPTDVIAQIFDAPETPAAPPFIVNTATPYAQELPAVASDPTGNFVVVWQSNPYGVEGGGSTTIQAQRYDASGNPTGAEFRVAPATARDPSVAYLADGSFVVAWQSDPVRARRYDAVGVPIGLTLQLGDFYAPTLAALAGGGFVLVGSRTTPDGGGREVLGQRFDASGVPVGSEFVAASPDVPSGIGTTSVTGTSDGGFLVGLYGGVRRFDASGAPAGPAFAVDAGEEIRAQVPAIAVSDSGEILAVFAGGGEPQAGTSSDDIFVRTFDVDGAPTGAAAPVNDHLGGDQDGVSVAKLSTGSFVVAWMTDGYAPGGHTAQGQHLRRVCDFEAEPGCDRCPGFDDSIDVDGDGRPDGCDPCINDGARDMFERTKLSISNPTVVDTLASKAHKMSLKGEFELAGPLGAFALLDPLSQGARVRVESAAGHAIADITLPAGELVGAASAGWRSNDSGTKWMYRDRGVATTEISKLKLVDRGAGASNRVSLKLKGFRGEFPIAPYYVPVKATATLGDDSAGQAGLCGETNFAIEDCSTGTRKLRCRM